MLDAVVTFRDVQKTDDLDRLAAALRRLSTDIGERFTSDHATLAQAVLGPSPAAHGLLALGDGETRSAALFSPVFSTVRGAAGVYVSDLWVSAAMRGQGVGAALLAQVAMRGAARWQATWLRLSVYDHSDAAQHFYKRLGFSPVSGMQDMRLGPEAVAQLIKRTA